MSSRAAPPTRLTAVITSIVQAAGYDLEDVVVTPAGRRSLVRVVVDADGGITLDQVAELSRALSEALDESEGSAMGAAPYVLEVSSPGVDRPLTQPRHWRRAVGRLVTLTQAEEGTVRGRVARSDDSGVVLDVNGEHLELPFERIASARVEVEFNRRSASEEES
ncbi:MAG: ribosome maturation factor RimP [Geodermatophilaceae bacterium]|jgi:ribosome maturation factor RimP|nr:ribosome maturation factor RimP [Geodermatophilaceae bacterium]